MKKATIYLGVPSYSAMTSEFPHVRQIKPIDLTCHWSSSVFLVLFSVVHVILCILGTNLFRQCIASSCSDKLIGAFCGLLINFLLTIIFIII